MFCFFVVTCYKTGITFSGIYLVVRITIAGVRHAMSVCVLARGGSSLISLATTSAAECCTHHPAPMCVSCNELALGMLGRPRFPAAPCRTPPSLPPARRAWCCWPSAPGHPASRPAQTSRPHPCRWGGLGSLGVGLGLGVGADGLHCSGAPQVWGGSSSHARMSGRPNACMCRLGATCLRGLRTMLLSHSPASGCAPPPGSRSRAI